VLKPAVSRLDAADNDTRIRELFLGGGKMALLVVIPIAAVLIVFNDRIMRIWLGDAFIPVEAEILSIIAIAAVFASWVRPAFFVVVGLGKHQLFGPAAVGQIVVAGVAAFIGLRAYGWGNVEVAWAFTIPEIVTVLFVLIPYCANQVGVSLATVFTRSVLPALLANLPAVSVLILLEASLRSLEGFSFILGLAGVALIVPLGAWLFGFTRDEKDALLRVLPMDRLRRGR